MKILCDLFVCLIEWLPSIVSRLYYMLSQLHQPSSEIWSHLGISFITNFYVSDKKEKTSGYSYVIITTVLTGVA
ncbi:hypothetical protein L6452_28258 [Arctium lappa]|uniref:Uncharacterized protein n=1 Tax=Arctium lappa TaxID=4217 RepID=A0ACB8ZYT8_ARCLA|nr:hypothetical protein L6452_28258 [Arctium lappa]